MTNQTETIQYLDPANVLISDNARFALKPPRVRSLADDIKASGGVQVPVEVEPIEGAADDEAEFRLTVGHYRHAAVSLLNKEGGSYTLPAIARPIGDSLMRLRTQVRENLQREEMSPMDTAIAVKALLDAGVSRQEVCETFARPGGRKGNVLQPASNAWLNMHLAFLSLPKQIQDKIHNGTLGVAAAWDLTRVTPDKRAAVLERAEKDRLAAIEREEKAEADYLKNEAKAQEAQAAEAQASAELEAAKADASAAAELVKAKKAEAREAAKAAKAIEDAKAAKQLIRDAEAAVKEAEKLAAQTSSKLGKLEGRVKTAAQLAKEKAQTLKAAREAEAKKKKSPNVTSTDIKRAAEAEGASTKFTPLNRAEIMKVLAELVLPGVPPIVAGVASAFQRCFNGEIPDDQLYIDLRKATGEFETPAEPTAGAKPKGKKAKA